MSIAVAAGGRRAYILPMVIAPPDPDQDENPIRQLRRWMRENFGPFRLSPENEAALYELEEYCDDQAGGPVLLVPSSRWDLGEPS